MKFSSSRLPTFQAPRLLSSSDCTQTFSSISHWGPEMSTRSPVILNHWWYSVVFIVLKICHSPILGLCLIIGLFFCLKLYSRFASRKKYVSKNNLFHISALYFYYYYLFFVILKSAGSYENLPYFDLNYICLNLYTKYYDFASINFLFPSSLLYLSQFVILIISGSSETILRLKYLPQALHKISRFCLKWKVWLPESFLHFSLLYLYLTICYIYYDFRDFWDPTLT